ncbi:MAG: NAD(P)-dependent oxidoreductase, partial [Chloroflexi bacterium]|nr:NAD(P)-dependent oxidoreductase [Chloroflexota bacterium]
PLDSYGYFFEGSIANRKQLPNYLEGIDLVIHIAAWHGIHEVQNLKSGYEFSELNVIGSAYLFEACSALNIPVVNISSTSVEDETGIYGQTKRMAEELAEWYVRLKKLKIITLRPRAFIPHWNHEVYDSFIDWAKWFWPGAVHINDVAIAVILAMAALLDGNLTYHLVLPLDSKYEFSFEELASWDKNGPATSFNRHYAEFYELALGYGLDPTLKPRRIDISLTEKILGYSPNYSILSLFQDLKEFGPVGPPRPY